MTLMRWADGEVGLHGRSIHGKRQACGKQIEKQSGNGYSSKLEGEVDDGGQQLQRPKDQPRDEAYPREGAVSDDDIIGACHDRGQCRVGAVDGDGTSTGTSTGNG